MELEDRLRDIEARLKVLEMLLSQSYETTQERIFAVARKEIGVTEVPGEKSNARIVEYHKSVGVNWGDEVPWCSSFVNWCCEQAGVKGTDKANARSWLDWGNFVSKADVKPGDLVVFWRGSVSGSLGHVGFVKSIDARGMTVVGGNQNDRVSAATYGFDRVLSFRRFKEAEPKES